MAKIVKPNPQAIAITRALCIEEFSFDPLSFVDPGICEGVDLEAPFLVDSNGWPIQVANDFVRMLGRHDPDDLGQRVLRPNSVLAVAKDLAYLLSTYRDHVPAGKTGCQKVLAHYRQQLEASDLAAATCERRALYGERFLGYVAGMPVSPIGELDILSEQLRRTAPNMTGQRINIASGKVSSFGRRRHPDLLLLLEPEELIRFFHSFDDPILSATPKIIFGTGARVSEVASLRAGVIATTQPVSPGRRAKLWVKGKGGKGRYLEVEPQLLRGLKRFLTSKKRLKRAIRYSNKYGIDPYSDAAPFLINKDGDPMTAPAITDAFRRASERTGIKRTPHELRHEFAVQYILNAYRSIAAGLRKDDLDAWLTRLMLDKAPAALLRLSHLLGHSSVETTKRTYMSLLVEADPAIRSAWANYLEKFELGDL